MNDAGAYLLLSTVAGLAVGVLSVAVARRERARGSAWWLLPLIGSVSLFVVCGMRLLLAWE